MTSTQNTLWIANKNLTQSVESAILDVDRALKQQIKTQDRQAKALKSRKKRTKMPAATQKTETTNEPRELTITDAVFDLDTFEEVTLQKKVLFTPIKDQDAALTMLSTDGEKMLRIINKGLEAELRSVEKKNPAGFQVVEDGDLKGEYTGTPANMANVNSLVLTMAKTMYGFSKDLSPEAKRTAKDAAKDFIRSQPAIKENLKKQAAASAEVED